MLKKAIFEEQEDNILHDRVSRGEIQLTDALEQVREKFGMIVFAPDERSYDIGLLEMYRQKFHVFGKYL